MKTYHLRGSLIVAAALTAASLWSSPLHLTSLPYSNSYGWSLESSTWDNKVVIHPEAFTFDLKNYSYKLKVNTSCSVQIGRAQWDSSNTTESNFVNMGNGGGGDFYVDITSSLANIIKAEKEEDRYCIQFNNDSGKLFSIELIATEKDPGDVNIDFTKGLHTDGTRILDGNGNEFVMRGLNGAWANLDEDFAKSASAWGCNAVRLNISNGNPADNWMGYTMSSGQLEGIIEYCEKYKMIAVPCPQNGTCMDDPAVLQYSVNFWKGMKDVLNRHVGSTILNITNEWYRGGDEYNGWDCVTTPRPQSEIDEAAKYWSEHYVSAVRELREAGIKSLILIDVAGCGQGAPVLNASYMAADGSIRYYAQDIIDADAEASGGKANVAFSIHMYQISGRNGETVRRNIDYCLDRNVPCVLGEFAFEHKRNVTPWSGGGPVAWIDIQEYAREKNVSWLAWSWHGNGGGAETCDMFDGNGGLEENGKCMIYGPHGIKMDSTPATIFQSNPGGPGLSYQYPVAALSDDEIYTNSRGHGDTGGDSGITEGESTDILDNAAETKTNDSSWNLYYTVDSSFFKDMDANGWLRIRIGDGGQTAVYINTGTDHNKRGSDHLIGDSHDSGQYYFTDVSGTLDSKVSLSDFLAKLKQYGLRIDCNGNSLLRLEYIAPVYPEKPEPGEEDLAEIQVSWKCNRTIDSDNLSEYYIPASRFAGMTTDHSLFIECQPEESAQSSRRRAAAEPVIKLYTRPDSGTTILSMVDLTELNMPAGMLASNPGYNLAVDSDVLNRLQADGLYIGGSGYKLMNVKAVPHGIYTEVEEIEEPVSTLPDAIFTINGIRVEEMVPGNLYIVVRNGKPEKVLFKKN